MSWRVRNADAGRKRFAIILRRTADEWRYGGIKREQEGIQRLAASGGDEETESCVVAQAVIDGEISRDAPGILGVDAEALDILRKAAVAGRSDAASCAGRDIGEGVAEQAVRSVVNCCGVRGVVRGIEDERSQRFRICGERAAHDRLVNEINSEARCVLPVVCVTS